MNYKPYYILISVLFLIFIGFVIYVFWSFSQWEPSPKVNRQEEQVKEAIDEYNDIYELRPQQIVFSYNAVEGQTDDSPCITASGYNICLGVGRFSNPSRKSDIVANNCYPFGTQVEIAGELYEVQDRMNSRYGCDYWDILKPTLEESLEWGIKRLDIKVYE